MAERSSDIGLLRAITNHPRGIAALFLATTILASWIVLAALALHPGEVTILSILCGDRRIDTPAALLASSAMWLTMLLAMMLPTALPMVTTYMDIAGAAKAKQIRVAPVIILIAGYLATWIVAAAVMTALLQLSRQWLSLDPRDERLIVAALLLAGLYQFAHLKHACLSKCRNPMQYFLSKWTERPWGVFRMGLEQGLFCLGCCWALMLLTFAAGSMSLLWMGMLTIVMVLEKTVRHSLLLTYGTGLGLLVAGVAIFFGS